METWVYLIIGISSAAWITHVFTCLSDDRWGFLIAGAIMAPIAIVHGIGIWFGFFSEAYKLYLLSDVFSV